MRLAYFAAAFSRGLPGVLQAGGAVTLVVGGSVLAVLELVSVGWVLAVLLLVLLLVIWEGGHRLTADAVKAREEAVDRLDTEDRARRRKLRTGLLPIINELRYARGLLQEAVDQKRYWWAAHGIVLPQDSWNVGGKQVLGEEAEESAAARDAYRRAEEAFNSLHELNLLIVRRIPGTEAQAQHLMAGAEVAPQVMPIVDGLTERVGKLDDALRAVTELIPE